MANNSYSLHPSHTANSHTGDVAQATSRRRKSSLLILLDVESPPGSGVFAGRYGPIFEHFNKYTRLIEVRTLSEALSALAWAYEGWSAVIVVEPCVIGTCNSVLSDHLVQYVKFGGTVIFEGRFGKFARGSDITRYFRNVWGLDWVSKGYELKEFRFTLNQDFVDPRVKEYAGDLPRHIQIYGTLLSNVPYEERLYVPCWPQVKGPPGQVPMVPNQEWLETTPAVFSRYEKGYLGWIGEDRVITSGETIAILSVMCNLNRLNQH